MAAVLPIVHPVPYVEPLVALAACAGEHMSVLLESTAPGPDSGRFAVVAIDPLEVIEADWHDAWPRLEALRATLPACAMPPGRPIGPGLFGVFGYELRRCFERLPSRHPKSDTIPDLLLGLFDTVIVFDLLERSTTIMAVDIDGGRSSASHRAAVLADRLRGAPDLPALDWAGQAEWKSDWSPAGYAAQVGRVLEYIRAGDIYQANFTQRWIARRPAALDALMLYRRLRAISPAPYGALIQDGRGNAIVSASPERFLTLSADGRVDTKPIKGTRPRSRTPEIDRAMAAELEASEKDRAENLMIVDLLRNDLGRVARTGSVTVPELNRLYSFSSVHHLVSTVTANLRPGLGPFDLLRATFPGGSVTGAPKIRAMEIIDELEAARRGAYCGAIGWIGLDGAMELSIAIRTMTLTGDQVIAQAGGGIVADSDPEAEHAEALTKARPMLATLDPTYRMALR